MVDRIQQLEGAFQTVRRIVLTEMGATAATQCAMEALLEVVGAIPGVNDHVSTKLEAYYSNQLVHSPTEESLDSFGLYKDLLQLSSASALGNGLEVLQAERWRRMEERISQLEEVNARIAPITDQSALAARYEPFS
jgi:hypothetical protein